MFSSIKPILLIYYLPCTILSTMDIINHASGLCFPRFAFLTTYEATVKMRNLRKRNRKKTLDSSELPIETETTEFRWVQLARVNIYLYMYLL